MMKNSGRLRENFVYQHCKLKVAIIQEVPEPTPRCNNYVMHMSAAGPIKNKRTAICNKATEMWLIWRDVEMTDRCGEM